MSHLKIKRKIRKNTREKQRRSELNDKFDELQALLQLGGGQTKVEKFAILSEAIGVIEQLKKDVAELRQEKVDTRAEVRKMTGVLEGFWPQNPEMAKEFAGRFFPRLSGVLSPPNSVGGGASVYGSRGECDGEWHWVVSERWSVRSPSPLTLTSQQQQHASDGPSSYNSGASAGSVAPSHSSLISPSGFLAFQQAAQQPPQPPPGILPPYAQLPITARPPSHRRGNSRNGSISSLNPQLYSSTSSIPGLGMGSLFPPIPPPPGVTPPRLPSQRFFFSSPQALPPHAAPCAHPQSEE